MPAKRFVQRFQDFVGIDREVARHAFGQIASRNLDLLDIFLREGAADLQLDALGRGLADQVPWLRRT
jgi:hypothetical protein